MCFCCTSWVYYSSLVDIYISVINLQRFIFLHMVISYYKQYTHILSYIYVTKFWHYKYRTSKRASLKWSLSIVLELFTVILVWATMNYSWSLPKHTTFPGFIHALLLAYFPQLTFRAWYMIKYLKNMQLPQHNLDSQAAVGCFQTSRKFSQFAALLRVNMIFEVEKWKERLLQDVSLLC